MKLREISPPLPRTICKVFTKYDEYPEVIEASYLPLFTAAKLKKNQNATAFYWFRKSCDYRIHKIVFGSEEVKFAYYKKVTGCSSAWFRAPDLGSGSRRSKSYHPDQGIRKK
jgi:hypothetical protein